MPGNLSHPPRDRGWCRFYWLADGPRIAYGESFIAYPFRPARNLVKGQFSEGLARTGAAMTMDVSLKRRPLSVPFCAREQRSLIDLDRG